MISKLCILRLPAMFLVLSICGRNSIGETLQIQGPSVAMQNDTVILMVPGEVTDGTFIQVSLNGVQLDRRDYEFADHLLVIHDADSGDYEVVARHGDGILEKAITVNPANTSPVPPRRFRSSRVQTVSALFQAADTDFTVDVTNDVVERIVELKDVDAKFVDNAIAIVSLLETKLTDARTSQTPESDVFAPVTDFLTGLDPKWIQVHRDTLHGLDPGNARDNTKFEHVTVLANGYSEALKRAIRATGGTPPSNGSAPNAGAADELIDPRIRAISEDEDFGDAFAEAIKERMFQLRVNDFDPDFQENCQTMADKIETITKEDHESSDALYREVNNTVKEVIDRVTGTEEVGEARKRWKDMYNEFSSIMFLMEFPKRQRATDSSIRKYYDRFAAEGHLYNKVVTSDEQFGRDDTVRQRRAFEIFVNGLNKAIDRDKVEVANALKKAGVTTGQGTGMAGAAAYGAVPSTFAGRWHRKRMKRIYRHHQLRTYGIWAH